MEVPEESLSYLWKCRLGLSEKEKERETVDNFPEITREMKLLREYVNGFELPRLKEANIRGRERYVQSLHQLVLQHGLDHESTVRPLEADFFLTFRILSTILSLSRQWNRVKEFFSLVVSFSLTKISC